MPVKKQIIPLFFILISAGILLTFSGCNLLVKKAPAIDQIFADNADAAFWISVDKLPIDWDALKARKPELESMLREAKEDQLLSIIREIQSDPEQIMTLAGSFSGLDQYIAQLDEDPDYLPEVLIGMDLKQTLTALEIVETINKNDQLNVTAKTSGKEGGFDLIEIHDPEGKLLFELAVFTAKQSQIRAGTPESILRSINEPHEGPFIREDMVRLEGQSWFYAKIPAEFNDSLDSLETFLPFEPGVLISGFKTAVLSIELTDISLDSTLTLEFENADDANTAFSYLQLGLNFALKPYIRKKTDGEGKHFIRSIRNENTGDLVKLSFSLNGEDLESVRRLFDNPSISQAMEYVLDLIKKP